MMSDLVSDEQRAVMIGDVILSARKVESKLRTLCGNTEVTGIHALTELLASRLPPDIQRQLHFIAAVRNNAAHETDFTPTAEEFKNFQNSCHNVLTSLERLFPEQPAVEDSGKEPENTLDLAVEKEAFAIMHKKLAKFGYFPLAGNIYLLYLLLCTILHRSFLLLLAGLYCSAVVLGIKGWQSSVDRGLLYVAGTALAFAAVATAILSLRSPVKRLPKIIGILPGINIIYLVIRWLCDLHWRNLLISVIGLGFFAGAIILAIKNLYSYGAAALFINWLFSLSAALFRGEKSEE